MNPRLWCFDLEMSQPSGYIIQIGGLVGRLDTGEIIETFNFYVNPHDQLSSFIKDLTGITQEQVDTGLELGEAALRLKEILDRTKPCKSPIVWGNGDLRCFQNQSGLLKDIHREIDIKTIYQFDCIKQGRGMKAGLDKALNSAGLAFQGRPHNALDDAINTFALARHYANLKS